jgi:hypothetical protein
MLFTDRIFSVLLGATFLPYNLHKSPSWRIGVLLAASLVFLRSFHALSSDPADLLGDPFDGDEQPDRAGAERRPAPGLSDCRRHDQPAGAGLLQI